MTEIPITIDNNSGIPIWLQLRNRLIYLITSGNFGVGEKLPTVRNLAVQLGINFNTVSKVYRDIERDGYIISRQGAGTFVSDEYKHRAGAAVTETELLIDEFIRQCLELGVPEDDIAGLVIERLMLTDHSEKQNSDLTEGDKTVTGKTMDSSKTDFAEQRSSRSQSDSRFSSQRRARSNK